MSYSINLQLSLKDCMKKNRRKIPLVFIYILRKCQFISCFLLNPVLRDTNRFNLKARLCHVLVPGVCRESRNSINVSGFAIKL